MQDLGDPSILAFPSEAEAIKWLLNEVYAQRQRIIQLEKENAAMKELEALREDVARERASDRKRIAKLENPRKPQDTHILDELYSEMQAIGRKQVDFATAAKMVKRSKSRLLQLKPEIGQDMRFILVPSESHSQKVLIRVRT